LKAGLAAVDLGASSTQSPALASALDTIEYNIQNIDLAESLASALSKDRDTLLKLTGDMALAYRTGGGELIRYRIFVPVEYDRSKRYSAVIALHSGEGDKAYFEQEACPGEGLHCRLPERG
jgi:predicted peptidase